MTAPTVAHLTMTPVAPLALTKGSFLIPEFSATGGVSYRRIGDGPSVQEGDVLETDYTTHKRVDHVGLVALSKSIVNRAYGVLDRLACNTPIGYFAPAEVADQIAQGLAPIMVAAREFNEAAKAMGSERRCRVACYSVTVSEDDASAAQRLTCVVRERLQDLRDALDARNAKDYSTAWDRARNLAKLATGIQSDAIQLALDSCKVQRTDMLRDQPTPIDFSMLDSALSLFPECD